MKSKVKKELRFDESPSTELVDEKIPQNSIIKTPLDVTKTIGILKTASLEKQDSIGNNIASPVINQVEFKSEPNTEIKIDSEESEVTKETTKDFRSRTPIEEDPAEDIQSPGVETPSPDLLSPKHIPEPTRRPSSPIPPHSPPRSPKTDCPTVILKSNSEESEEEITAKPPIKEDNLKPESAMRSQSNSQCPSLTSDKGKSKTTGKTIGGWL